MLFFYIRHGDPIYNPDSLTPLGKRQAEAVGRRVAAHGLNRVYASSSTRAIETATPAAEMTHNKVMILDWANEGHFWREAAAPDFDGKRRWMFDNRKYREIFNSLEMRRLGDDWRSHPALAETDLAAGCDRIARESDAFFEALGYRHDRENFRWEAVAPTSERVAFFAHGGFVTGFLSDVLGIPYPLFATHFSLSHSGMTVIRFAESEGYFQPQLLMWSSDGHLWRDGLPTAFNNGSYI